MPYLFETELAAFEAALPDLLRRSPGKYALIKGDQVDSCWSTYEDAVQAGYRFFGLEPFLVKRVEAVETPVVIPGYRFAQCQSRRSPSAPRGRPWTC